MKEFKESVEQFFMFIEELQARGEINVETMVLTHDFKTDDCDLYFYCGGKRSIYFTENKKN
jgi:hypothetical protein